MVIDGGHSLSLKGGGNFITINGGGISSSKIIGVGGSAGSATSASPGPATLPGSIDKQGLGQVSTSVATQTPEMMAALTPGQLQYQHMLQKTAPVLNKAALTDQPLIADCQRQADGRCHLSGCPCEPVASSGGTNNEPSSSYAEQTIEKIHAQIKQAATSPDATFTQSVSQRGNDFGPGSSAVSLSQFGKVVGGRTHTLQGGSDS